MMEERRVPELRIQPAYPSIHSNPILSSVTHKLCWP